MPTATSRHWLSCSVSVSHDASQDSSGNRIRRVDLATGMVTTLAGSGSTFYGSAGNGDGAGVSARFHQPWGIAIHPSGTFALVGVRRPPPCPPHPAIPQTAHPPRTRRRCRTGFQCGQTSGSRALPLSVCSPMMHRRTIATSGSAVSKSPPGRPPRSPAAAGGASATAPALSPSSTYRMASRSTRAAPSRSSRCVGRSRTPAFRHPADGTTPASHTA